MFPMITNIYNKKTKGPNLMELNQVKLMATWLQFTLIALDYAENWPEPTKRHI
jgi:hypothetical protein